MWDTKRKPGEREAKIWNVREGEQLRGEDPGGGLACVKALRQDRAWHV